MASYSIIREDITKLKNVDVIVNAASGTLFHGAGVCGAIHSAAGKELDVECKQFIKKNGQLQVSDVATTGSHNLSKQGIKKIIHVVGPMFDNSNPKQSELELEKAIKNVLNEVFIELKLNSVAIPAISCGIYRFPKKLCAEVFKRTIPLDKNIILCNYDEDTYNIFRDEFKVEEQKIYSSQQQKIAMLETEIASLKQTIALHQQQLSNEVDKKFVSIWQENILSFTNLNSQKNFEINQLEEKNTKLTSLYQTELKEVTKLKEQIMELMVKNSEIKELKDENEKLKLINNDMKQLIETLSQKFDPSNVVKGNLINVNQYFQHIAQIENNDKFTEELILKLQEQTQLNQENEEKLKIERIKSIELAKKNQEHLSLLFLQHIEIVRLKKLPF